MISTESTVVINRPVEEVFAFVSDCRNEPQWHTEVIEAAPISSEPPQVGSTQRWVLRFMGKPRENIMRITDLVPNRLISLQGEKVIMGMRAAMTYRFEPVPEGTAFSRYIQLEMSGGARLMQPMMKAMGPRRNAQVMHNLKARLERE